MKEERKSFFPFLFNTELALFWHHQSNNGNIRMKCDRLQRNFLGDYPRISNFGIGQNFKTCTTRVLIISSQNFYLGFWPLPNQFYSGFWKWPQKNYLAYFWPRRPLPLENWLRRIALFGGLNGSQNFTGSVNDCSSLAQKFSDAFESSLFVL